MSLIDDDFVDHFQLNWPENFVHCPKLFNQDCFSRANEILNDSLNLHLIPLIQNYQGLTSPLESLSSIDLDMSDTVALVKLCLHHFLARLVFFGRLCSIIFSLEINTFLSLFIDLREKL